VPASWAAPTKLARQQKKGRLHARARIEKLLDAGSFDEYGLLAVSDLPGMEDKTPADGKVCGWGAIEQRGVFVSADDVTVLAGGRRTHRCRQAIERNARPRRSAAGPAWCWATPVARACRTSWAAPA